MPSLTWVLVVLASTTIVSAAPAPWNRSGVSSLQKGNIYTGPGGHASGGSVSENGLTNSPISGLLDMPIVNLDSNNAGDGGRADSGNGLAHRGHHHHHEEYPSQSSSMSSNTYIGAAGDAIGGSSNGGEGLLNIFSNNAGKGGDATSGYGEALGI